MYGLIKIKSNLREIKWAVVSEFVCVCVCVQVCVSVRVSFKGIDKRITISIGNGMDFVMSLCFPGQGLIELIGK